MPPPPPREYNVLCKVTSNSWQAFCPVNVEGALGQSASTEARWEIQSLPATPPHPAGASPLTPPSSICADLPLAVNSSRAGCGISHPCVAADYTAVQMLSTARPNICAPCGNTLLRSGSLWYCVKFLDVLCGIISPAQLNEAPPWHYALSVAKTCYGD